MRIINRHFAAALAVLGLTAGHASGQQAPAGCAPAPALADSSGVPVLIVARVHADAIVFETDPDVLVTVNGCAPEGGQVVRTSNLPDPIVPGVRYTDVDVTVEYRAVLKLECRAPEESVARLCAELKEGPR